tara:strand:- start:1222 stop:1356 length:135 start_codon:yes stop_codon:yes gene_type:complete
MCLLIDLITQQNDFANQLGLSAIEIWRLLGQKGVCHMKYIFNKQ